MFKLSSKLILAASVLIFGTFAANAQISNGYALKVDVPNAFTLKDETFPAGTYTIERTPNTVDSPSILIIRGENGESMIFDTMIARTHNAAKATQLVFDTVGDTYYLTAIVVKGEVASNAIPRTKAQTRKMAETSAVRHYLTITDTGL